ncbi:hypothetical protein B0J14DRAFT_651284 [Halenospora varia]|nr:hypothetical protein B0J14DRAFT_651284 [Halenospora varia]
MSTTMPECQFGPLNQNAGHIGEVQDYPIQYRYNPKDGTKLSGVDPIHKLPPYVRCVKGSHQPKSIGSGGTSAFNFLKKPKDHEMAKKQTNIRQMTGVEKEEQEEWAQRQIRKYKDTRIRKVEWQYYYNKEKGFGGYIFTADYKSDEDGYWLFLPDILIAEGRGGYMMKSGVSHRSASLDDTLWAGPFYSGEDDAAFMVWEMDEYWPREYWMLE